MPDTGNEPQGNSVASPVAPAPDSGQAIIDAAKAEAAAFDAPATETPAEAAPAATERPPESQPNETQAPSGDEPKGTRRERGEQMREQIRKELEAEYESKRAADTQRQQAQQHQREFEQLVAEANAPEDGTFDGAQRRATAQQKLGQLLASSTATSAAEWNGRNAVLTELGRDISDAITKLDGLDEDGRKTLQQSPSVAEFGSRAFALGKQLSDAAHESRMATLSAEIQSLKGKLAAAGPSPLGATGTAGNGTASSAKGMRGIAAQVAQELGIPLQV